MADDVKALIAEAREWVSWNYGISQSENQNVASILERLADALEAATVAPAVDREALVWQMYDLLGGDTALGSPFMPDEGIAHNARSVVDALLAFGLLRDVRDVQAEALEAEGFAFTDAEWTTYQRLPEQGVSHRGHLEHVVNSRVRARAQAIREARNG